MRIHIKFWTLKVEIDKPLANREFGDADLDRHQKHLWQLMRDEARAADAELIHV